MVSYFVLLEYSLLIAAARILIIYCSIFMCVSFVRKLEIGSIFDGTAEHLNVPPINKTTVNRKKLKLRIFLMSSYARNTHRNTFLQVRGHKRIFLAKTYKHALCENDLLYKT